MKLHRNDSWVVPYKSDINCSGWLHRWVTGVKKGVFRVQTLLNINIMAMITMALYQ